MTATTLPPISEARYQAQVLEAALIEGWVFAYHPWTSLHSASGFPDLILGHPNRNRVLALEVKRENGKATRAQLAWIDFLDRVPGITARVVRPSDWEWIVAELRRA